MTDEAVEAAEAPEVAETPVVATEQPAQPQREWSDEDESEAKAFGWKSEDEWKGEKPEGYIGDPRKYLDRVQGTRVFKAMAERADAAARDSAEAMRKIEAVNAAAMKRQKEQFEAELTRLKGEQRKAAEVGDLEAYDRAGQAMDKLPRPEEPKAAEPGVDPYIMEYAAKPENGWIKDPMLFDFASRAISAAGKGNLPAKDQVEYAEAQVKKYYPHLFPAKPAAPQRQMVDGGGLGAARKDAFSQLPSEAKAAFKRFVGEGLYKDDEAGRKAYVDEYGAA